MVPSIGRDLYTNLAIIDTFRQNVAFRQNDRVYTGLKTPKNSDFNVF